MTTAAAVEEKVVDLEKDHFHDSGSVNVDGSILKCWKAGGHGDQTFLQVLQNSCNLGYKEEILLNKKDYHKVIIKEIEFILSFLSCIIICLHII